MSNNHAAMCVYCGEAVIYDTREVTDMANAHAKIVEHDQQCPRNPLVARIAELEKALERTVDQAERCLNEACCSAVEKLTELAPHMGWDAGEETAKLHMRRVRAAALLKEKD